MIAISKYSSRLDNQFHYQVISLKKACQGAIALAQDAGMEYLDKFNKIVKITTN